MDRQEAETRLNACIKEIIDCHINGVLDPFDALTLYVRCINKLIGPFEA